MTGKRGRTRTRPDTEAVERERARARQYYRENREEVLAKAKRRNKGEKIVRIKKDPELVRAKTLETKKRRADANKEWMRNYKMTSGCLDCGYAQNPVALQFDHRPGTVKSFMLSSRPNMSRKRLEEEVAKCDVRCANCHAVVTERRRREGI